MDSFIDGYPLPAQMILVQFAKDTRGDHLFTATYISYKNAKGQTIEKGFALNEKTISHDFVLDMKRAIYCSDQRSKVASNLYFILISVVFMLHPALFKLS